MMSDRRKIDMGGTHKNNTLDHLFKCSTCSSSEILNSLSSMYIFEYRRTGFNCVVHLSLFSYIANLITASAQIARRVGLLIE